MSAVTRKKRHLERYRPKVKGKKIPERTGRGRADVRAARVVNVQATLALKKVSGKRAREFDSFGVEELKTRLDEARKEFFNLRFKHATGLLDNVASIPAAKRRVARILTLIKQKEAGI